jgi:hypothetical protein
LDMFSPKFCESDKNRPAGGNGEPASARSSVSPIDAWTDHAPLYEKDF